MQVFISHSSADRPIAEALTTALRNAGIDVWNPYDSLMPGDNWALETGKAIEGSDVMVVLFTGHGGDSVTLNQEVQYALTSGKYRGRVIPVLDFVTFQPGRDVPWVLMRMDPIYSRENPSYIEQVVHRVQQVMGTGCNATA